MRKYRIVSMIALIVVIFIVMFSMAYPISNDQKHKLKTSVSKYEDVSNKEWYFNSLEVLSNDDIIPVEDKFNGDAPATSYDALLYIYNLSEIMGVEPVKEEETETEGEKKSDAKSTDSNAISVLGWAQLTGVIEEALGTEFVPEQEFTKEQLCSIIAGFMDYAGIKASVKDDTKPFKDTLYVSETAAESVAALKMAGIIEADKKGNVNPKNIVTKGELAGTLGYLYGISKFQVENGKDYVDVDSASFRKWYKEYKQLAVEAHEPLLKKTKPVDLKYFDDAVFIGDSVTMSLQYYSASTGCLGKAGFLCAASQSAASTTIKITGGTVDPRYHGATVAVEEGVALMNAKKVYIMLGINSLFYVDETVIDVYNLAKRIVDRNPDATIILQSVTPTTKDSPLKTKRMKIDNELINGYNDQLYNMAKENGWYYLNVSEAVSDKKGNLRDDYCSDPQTMGIHFTYEADQAWVDYLMTHPLKTE